MRDLTRYYFAYGSNCNLAQMRYRCPKAERLGVGVIEGYALSFYGGYGSGVASIVRRRGCSVWGLLWRITIACEQSLDRYEGFPYLYRKEWHSVVGEGNIGKVRGMVYVMNCDTYALPSDSYFSGIKDGFIDNGIPVTSLVRALEETKARCRLVQGGRHIG